MTDKKSNVVSMNPLSGTVREKVQKLIDVSKMPQAEICRQSGVTSGQLSPWLKGKYAGDNQAVEEKLQQWLDVRARKAQLARTMPGEPPWLETPTGRKMYSVLAFAQMAATIGVIYGGAGLGKSSTTRAYAAQTPNVWRVEMSKAACAMGSALDEIAHVLGVKTVSGRPGLVHRALVDRLRGTGGLLIIDEAQHLRTEALEAIRGLHDLAGVGLVLSGNETVYARMTGGGTREASFAQLFSRIGKRLRLTRPEAADIQALVEHYGVTDPEAVAVLKEIAAKPGALRGMVLTIRLAAMLAAGEEAAEITPDHIRAAWREQAGAE